MSLRTLLFVFALACRGGGDKESQHQESVPDTAPPEYVDDDGDGYATDEDCDDTDAQIHPDAEEICDNIDQNCDGVLDEGVLHTYYTDADGDGYGDAASEVQSCQTESGTVPNGNDCDDSSGDVYPGAPERCDGLDNDCDDDIDEDDQQTWYTDSDGDGYGDPSTAITTCEAPEDGTLDGSDCDDTDPSASPEGVEICDGIDNDCDGDIDDDLAEDRTTWYEDRDEDGYGDPDLGVLACAQPDGYSDLDTDCDDLAPESFPGADEVCDDADNDCDGSVDEDALDASAWFPDLDHDTYGDPRTVVLSCEAPSGYTDDYSDCDDTDGTEHPAADEICDGDDDDCDGDIDEDDAIDRGTWYSDRDLDGYGDPSTEVAACDAPAGAVDNGLDCDDDDTGENPDAAEICDGDDDDCDGDVDESDAVDASTWHQDRDDDGYGDDARTTTACDAPSGYVARGEDCDDLDATAYPTATEVCDDVDNDCDGDIDGGAADTSTWYRDSDSDLYGDPATTRDACDKPLGYVSNAADCDDSDRRENPAASEICDGDDDDCDGDIDEDGADAATWYADADGDGYGDPATTTASCSAPTGYVDNAQDCDDADASENPAASEVCDGDDDDCDGSTDESGATDAITWYQDRDGDTYGDPSRSTVSCEAPTGYVANDDDCDDLATDTYPGATEVCDDEDNDCDGSTDEDATDASTWHRDSDSDLYGDPLVSKDACDKPTGYVSNSADCDDSDRLENPAASEVCDGDDDDCDGAIDEDSATDADTWYADGDGDTYGSPSSTSKACSQPTGYVGNALDCDDADASENPAASEVCDGDDDDCDGSVDESGATDAATWYQDRDDDSYGDPSRSTVACTAPTGYVGNDDDCDDLADSSYPGAPEVCDDDDNDCDGTVDDGASDALTWYQDADRDSYGDPARTTAACDAPSGYVANDDDCDDGDAHENPAASEVCDGDDDDCDGSVDESSATDANTWYADNDSDTYGSTSTTTKACSQPTGYVNNDDDCDDGDASENPAASEVCDGDDDDCDGSADESSAVDAGSWYQDRDDDSYGDPSRSTVACTAPTGYVANDDDCDDLADSSYPGAPEVCDDKDNDCDGVADNGASDALTWYQDGDSDLYGDPSKTTTSCDAPTGYVGNDDDCDDSDATENPSAREYCDGDDDDCDGSTDESSAVDASTWYADSDADTYGSAASSTKACSQPTGYVNNDDDCDDSDASENPAASEVCDGDDDDCDGAADESSAVDAPTWYQDRDTDTYGDPATSSVSCAAPTGYVDNGDDCDDLSADSYPGGVEVCDDEDNDCDGTVDDSATDASTWYRDADSDLYGNPSRSTTACDAPTGYVNNDEDCDDTDSANSPSGTEVCDDEDNDCDGDIDESGAYGESSWYPDADGDTYGDDAGVATTACDAPTGYVAGNTDCDDTSASVHPGATEYCNATDEDCDGDEDGAVTFYTSLGVATDLSSTWASGTATTPKSVSYTSSGSIYVCPGTYYVAVTSSATSLAIRGRYGADETTLSGGGSKRVVTATGSLTMSGLTVTQGYSSTSYGGGVYVNGANASISDCTFVDNSAKYGAAVALRTGTLTLDSVDISGGDATYGGALYLGSATLDLTTGLLYDNTATYGGAIYGTGATLTIDDTDISSNTATSYGGGLSLVGSSDATVTATEVTENAAGDYGGGAYLSASSYTMSTSNVSYNSASLLGAGFYMTDVSAVSCTGTTSDTYGIWGNTALAGGGVYMNATSGATITSTRCDWTASQDNDLYDIVIGFYLYYTKANNATFSCTWTGC